MIELTVTEVMVVSGGGGIASAPPALTSGMWVGVMTLDLSGDPTQPPIK